MYEAMGGTRWENSSGWLTDAPLDDWYGVDEVGGRVVTLELPDNGLVGELPSAIAALDRLNTLDLRWNTIIGAIPESLGSMASLETLLLSGNQLNGAIPQQWGSESRLKRLDLSYNGLIGEIPETLGNLKSLQSMGLGHNNLTGSIPNSLAGIKTLKRVIANNNRLYGSLTSAFSKSEELHLNVKENYIDQPLAEATKGEVVVISGKSAKALHGVDFLDETTLVVEDEQASAFTTEVMRAIEVRDGFLHLNGKVLPRSVDAELVQDLVHGMNGRLVEKGETIRTVSDLERVFELYSGGGIAVPDHTSHQRSIHHQPSGFATLDNSGNGADFNAFNSTDVIHHVNCRDRTDVRHAHLSSDRVNIKGKVAGECYWVSGTTHFEVYLYVVMAREKKFGFVRYFKHIKRSRKHTRSNPDLVWSARTAYVDTPCTKDDKYRTEAEFYAWSPVVGWYWPGPWLAYSNNGTPQKIRC
ncbi:MAG: hypothetical protein OXJ53_13855 [Gammaproteobacteria bacterium]|nr:hypothetical protein [Gammaproteobacteria bacterium]